MENRLGLQVFRALGKHLILRLRTGRFQSRDSCVEILQRDGVVAIPDFLAAAEFREVTSEMEALRRDLRFEDFRHLPGRVQVARAMLGDHESTLPGMVRLLQDNVRILQILSAASGIAAKAPTCEIIIFRSLGDGLEDNDLENVLHADLHSPTWKAFYYFSDVDETNGAFVYAKGSARLTLARLRHEYDISVRAARLRRGDTGLESDQVACRAGRRRATVSARTLRAMNVVETPICVRANTLVIANTMGFHRRGDFTGARERVSMVINFRNLQRPFLS